MNRSVLVYDPTAAGDLNQGKLAARLASGDGKVIGLLDNTKDLVDVLFDEVQRLFKADFPGAEFRYFRKESVSGARPELMEQLRMCNAVITAVGD